MYCTQLVDHYVEEKGKDADDVCWIDQVQDACRYVRPVEPPWCDDCCLERLKFLHGKNKKKALGLFNLRNKNKKKLHLLFIMYQFHWPHHNAYLSLLMQFTNMIVDDVVCPFNCPCAPFFSPVLLFAFVRTRSFLHFPLILPLPAHPRFFHCRVELWIVFESRDIPSASGKGDFPTPHVPPSPPFSTHSRFLFPSLCCVFPTSSTKRALFFSFLFCSTQFCYREESKRGFCLLFVRRVEKVHETHSRPILAAYFFFVATRTQPRKRSSELSERFFCSNDPYLFGEERKKHPLLRDRK